jgi:hypothetical protein
MAVYLGSGHTYTHTHIHTCGIVAGTLTKDVLVGEPLGEEASRQAVVDFDDLRTQFGVEEQLQVNHACMARAHDSPSTCAHVCKFVIAALACFVSCVQLRVRSIQTRARCYMSDTTHT